MEVVIPQEMAAAIDRLRDVLQEQFAKLAGGAHVVPEQKYFTREEAADYLRMSPRMLDNLSEAGDLRRAKLGEERKSKVLFRRVDLDAYVEGQLEMDRHRAKEHVKKLRE